MAGMFAERSDLYYGRNDFCTLNCHHYDGSGCAQYSETEKIGRMRRKLQWMLWRMYVSLKRYEENKIDLEAMKTRIARI